MSNIICMNPKADHKQCYECAKNIKYNAESAKLHTFIRHELIKNDLHELICEGFIQYKIQEKENINDK